jgi:hypothetical protein
MYARAPASQFLPHNSSASQSMFVVSMQMDAYLKRSRLVPFLSKWGHGKWFLGGGGGAGGARPNFGPPGQSFFFLPPAAHIIIHNAIRIINNNRLGTGGEVLGKVQFLARAQNCVTCVRAVVG